MTSKESTTSSSESVIDLLVQALDDMESPQKPRNSSYGLHPVETSSLPLLSSSEILKSCLQRLSVNPQNIRKPNFFSSEDLSALSDEQRKTLGDAIAVSLFDGRLYTYKSAKPATGIHNAKKFRYLCHNYGFANATKGIRMVFLISSQFFNFLMSKYILIGQVCIVYVSLLLYGCTFHDSFLISLLELFFLGSFLLNLLVSTLIKSNFNSCTLSLGNCEEG
jgi:hypothetical protein